SEPLPTTTGVPEKCTVLPLALSWIRTLSSGPAAGRAIRLKQAAAFSVNVKLAVPLDVPLIGIVPADVTVTDASAAGAATVATREASRVAVNAIPAPFLRIFK